MKKILTMIGSLAVVTPVVTGAVIACNGVDYTELDSINGTVKAVLANITAITWNSMNEATLEKTIDDVVHFVNSSAESTVAEGAIDQVAQKVTYTLSLKNISKTYEYSWAKPIS